MIVVVASGKGGTGKTTVAAALAAAVGDRVRLRFIDADVEEPNAAILLHPFITSEDDVYVEVPKIDEKRCSHCGECARACRFNALAVLPDSVMLFEQLCHSCRTCEIVCGEGAVGWKRRIVGRIRRGFVETDWRRIEFMEGRLNVGEARATPIIEALKERASDECDTLVDCSPGTGCAVIETLRLADFVLLVTEPTRFGMSDLEMAAEAAKRLGLEAGVVINRATYGDAAGARRLITRLGLDVLLELPYEADVAKAYSRGKTLLDARPQWRERFEELWWDVARRVARAKAAQRRHR